MKIPDAENKNGSPNYGDRPIVNLDAIDVRIPVRINGVVMPARQFNGVAFKLLAERDGRSPSDQTQIMYKIAAECLPEMSEEEVMKLSLLQVMHVLGVVQEASTEDLTKTLHRALENEPPKEGE